MKLDTDLNKTGIIIAARSNSKRLPNKHFLKVLKKPIIEIMIKRLKLINPKIKIIIATTKKKEDLKFVKLAERLCINIYRGDEKNVTKRILECAKKLKLKYICEITGDCPIIDIKLVEQNLKTFLNNVNNVDIVLNGVGLPNGMGCQVYKTSALNKSFKLIKKKDEYEHVTLCMRRNTNIFRQVNISPLTEYTFPDLAVTLDEYQDFLLIKKIIEHFFKKKKMLFDCRDVINFVKSKKSLLMLNASIQRVDNTLKL